MEAYAKILTYIDHNPIATLGTIGENGAPHGAAVYVCTDDYRHVIYLLTKTKTQKYKNLKDHNQVSITIVNPNENSSLQMSGRAFTVNDPKVIDTAMKKINRTHASAPEWLPPLAKLNAGAYVLVGVEIASARLAQFKGMAIGDEHIFTEA